MNATAPHPHTIPLVDIRGLRKRYGGNEVLKGVDLQVGRGEVVSIIGKSGSGKSTLLRCINGLESFHEGQLTVHGQRREVTGTYAIRRRGASLDLQLSVDLRLDDFGMSPPPHPALRVTTTMQYALRVTLQPTPER